jgi:hypothetical protein
MAFNEDYSTEHRCEHLALIWTYGRLALNAQFAD